MGQRSKEWVKAAVSRGTPVQPDGRTLYGYATMENTPSHDHLGMPYAPASKRGSKNTSTIQLAPILTLELLR